MKLDRRSLRSKVARRIFLLFIACALLPIGTLAAVSLLSVSRQLDDHSRARLAEATKAHGMAIYDRLRSAEASLALVAARLESDLDERDLAADAAERFDAVMLVAAAAESVLLGEPFSVPPLADDARPHLDSGAGVVLTSPEDGRAPRVVMSLGLTAADGAPRRLVGSILPSYLWGLEGLSEITALSVLDENGRVLASSGSVAQTVFDDVEQRLVESSIGRIEWSDGSDEYLSSYWSLFLKARFHVAGWTIILSEPLAYVRGPIGEFRNWFVWITVMSIWVVALVSLVQIRRNLVPLEALREGTRRIAAKEFDARVTVTSGDEFQDLAESFNGMAGRLGKQFSALTTINEIDKAVLSKLHTNDVVDTALDSIRQLVACDEVCVGVDSGERPTFVVHARSAREAAGRAVVHPTVDDADLERLCQANGHVLDDAGSGMPSYARPLAKRGTSSFLTVPLRVGESLAGFVCFGQATARGFAAEDIQQVRQVCDQIAVALANAKLVEELDRFTWGTLRALARAIDAKSPWTAGHSERVTDMALKIAAHFPFSASELETLRRGGLLHDIGKIGVPAEILDKPGRLTDEEYTVMRDHVRIGGTILEPLTAFADALPIVWEHHEWVNGNGYPKGLTGEEMTLGGRATGWPTCSTRSPLIDRIERGCRSSGSSASSPRAAARSSPRRSSTCLPEGHGR